ncbi:hypothetical protein BD626DRAFT_491896 [Schizophyllum amplum]|uniref:Uncharacterized protein n=1 Tax=Schizophyllum amplum TaxID=97359 RepID=A0A550CI31_9AGAR|nr:hypothetical protein BD626DRAFT_491896 [Auriculariopsis ampla]
MVRRGGGARRLSSQRTSPLATWAYVSTYVVRRCFLAAMDPLQTTLAATSGVGSDVYDAIRRYAIPCLPYGLDSSLLVLRVPPETSAKLASTCSWSVSPLRLPMYLFIDSSLPRRTFWSSRVRCGAGESSQLRLKSFTGLSDGMLLTNDMSIHVGPKAVYRGAGPYATSASLLLVLLAHCS